MYRTINPLLLPVLVIVTLLISSRMLNASEPAGKPGRAMKEITPVLMKEYIDYLASDELQGRDTPGPGLEKAAEFIAARFAEFGLHPLNGSYFQSFSICSKNLADSCYLNIKTQGTEVSFHIKSGFVPYENTGSRTADGQVVFAGYGITAPELKYDDYRGIDAAGKVVLIFRHEPGEDDSTASLFKGTASTKYSNLFDKIKNAREHGAIGVMVVTEPLNYKTIRPRGFPWPSLTKTLPRDALPFGYCFNDADSIPVIQVGEEVIASLLGSIDSLKYIQHLIDSTMTPCSFLLRGSEAVISTPVIKSEKYVVRNVAGLLPGKDPALKDETVVVGAHYDHVGISREKGPGGDSICNGADDNASGTAGVMAVAKAMTSMKLKPDRSVLFLLFAGEEKGLYGSGFYVKNPLLPLANTVVMLNMDMIGRNSPDTLEINGAFQCPELTAIIRKENRKTGFTLELKNMTGGSDHWNFYKKDVPSIHFFTGLHIDYHQVSDNPDQINAEKAARVARLVFLTAWETANDDSRYPVFEVEDEESVY